MPSEITPASLPLSTREGEAAQAQFSTSDYGSVGDQRPYQIVFPSYPAPKFLSRYAYLNDALRECGTLCQLKGQPFRLIKWGARVPCYPCRGRKSSNELPGFKIRSPGALEGFPNCTPIADFSPHGSTLVYGPDGQPKLVGGPNFVITRTPNPAAEFVNYKAQIPKRYLEAVKSAQYLADATGKNTYLCSSLGADCGKDKKLVPIVYVQPGGLVKRYRSDLALKNGVPDSEVAATTVTEAEFRELLRESEGRTRLGQGA
jgi:hypothetical protein